MNQKPLNLDGNSLGPLDEEYVPAEGIARNLCGTPPILNMASLDSVLLEIMQTSQWREQRFQTRDYVT